MLRIEVVQQGSQPVEQEVFPVGPGDADLQALRRNDRAEILDDGGKQRPGGLREEAVQVGGAGRRPRSAVCSKNSNMASMLPRLVERR